MFFFDIFGMDGLISIFDFEWGDGSFSDNFERGLGNDLGFESNTLSQVSLLILLLWL
jgi:hypothetical protein